MQGQGPYAKELKSIETDIKEIQKKINEKIGKNDKQFYDNYDSVHTVASPLSLLKKPLAIFSLTHRSSASPSTSS